MTSDNDAAAPSESLRSVDDPTNSIPTLLTLPLTDFEKPKPSAEFPPPDSDADDDRLLLLQLPPTKKGSCPSLSVADLLSGTSKIVGGTEYDDDDEEGQSRQACLVVESTGKSFSLSRVETSNAYVLVPPQCPCTEEAAPSAAEDSCGTFPKADGFPEGGFESPTKKRKILTAMAARLLPGPGGEGTSGASFLELQPRPLPQRLLRKKISDHVFDPYQPPSNVSSFGVSAESLARDLQSAEGQVRKALHAMHAFLLRGRYGLLSEEARYEGTMAIVSSLNECEELMDYTNGIDEGRCVEESAKRWRESEGGEVGMVEEAVRHCLGTLVATSDDRKGERVKLDVGKIALFLAQHLFNTRRSPWLQSKFLSEWQRLIPGVGDAYRPSVDLLRGVALHSPTRPLVVSSTSSGTGECEGEDDDGSGYLQYYPEEKLPLDPDLRFHKLFGERERWTLEELGPYLDRVVEGGEHGTKAEVLLRYTRIVVEQEGGVKTKWYMQR